MSEKGGIAVVFWGPHSISTEMFARRLNASCYLIHYLGWKRHWMAPLKYPPMWLKTWWVLLKQRPSAVLVINTPVFAPLCVYIYCLFTKTPFAMNVHGHTLAGKLWGWSRPLQHFLAKRSVANLVGTTEYYQIFKSWGAPALFLEDPPIEVPPKDPNFVPKPADFRVTVISTFAGDEPLDLVLEAARRLPDIKFDITGETRLAKKDFLDSAPSNVTFTGYLKGQDYWNQLYFSQAMMTLTTNPHSLVAGGLEGMYMGKPLILSRQPALVEYFTKGTVFIEHSVDSIVDGVQQARQDEERLVKEVGELNAEHCARWERTFFEFRKMLGETVYE